MTCTASSLAGLGLRDRHNLQALGSRLAAVGSCLDKARVHHISHPGHCHRGLSYIGGQNDPHSSYIGGQDDLHSSYIGGQDDLHSSANPMPLLLVMAHCREWQRSIHHTVQRLKADYECSLKSDPYNVVKQRAVWSAPLDIATILPSLFVSNVLFVSF